MCFSASASFISSIVLFVIGILVLKANNRKRYKLFSIIPILFAIQQLSEGFVWLSIQNPSISFLHGISTNTFLLFAILIWPVFIPFSMMKAEKHKSRYKILKGLTALGVIWTLYVAVGMLTFQSTSAAVEGHIYYSIEIFSYFTALHVLLYFLLTIVPFFVTHIRPLWALGGLMSIAAFVSYLTWGRFFISVWCFFAAAVSIFIYFIIKADRIEDNPNNVLFRFFEN